MIKLPEDSYQNGVYICGDTHGNWSVIENFIKQHGMTDCLIFHVGDVGIGFSNCERGIWPIRELCEEKRITIIAIRGNHDDPDKFTDDVSPYIVNLVKDDTILSIGGKYFLLVGGALSIDRSIRTEGKSWWSGEKFIYKQQALPKIDFVITHSSPPTMFPPTLHMPGNVRGWVTTERNNPKWKEYSLWDECVAERKEIGKLYKDVVGDNPIWYYGHFHDSISDQDENGIQYHCLDINEIKEIVL